MALMAGRGSLGGPGLTHWKTVYKNQRLGVNTDDRTVTCGCIPAVERKKSRTKMLKERIRQFSIWYFENEDQKEVEHVKRRLQRKKRRKTARDLKGIRCLRWLYYIDIVIWTVGLTFTLCSTVETIGENTPFFKHKKLYRIIGPLTLLMAILLLLILSAVKRRYLKANQMKRPKRSFYILPKKEKKIVKRADCCETDDSGNVEDIDKDEIPEKQNISVTKKDADYGKGSGVSKEMVKTVNDTQDTGKLERLPYETRDPLARNIMSRADKRKAWAKTKWMRVNRSTESTDSLEDLSHILGHHQTSGTSMLQTKDSLERYPILKSVSVDSESLDTVSALTDEPVTLIKREFSTKSKTSEVSNFSNFSETAPLVKK